MRTLHILALLGALLFSGHATASPPVDINTADAEVLAEAIRGVGLRRAEAIVAYREKNGPFTSVDELLNVRGIGERILEDARGTLTVKPMQ
jgi:competence protein ComEA